MSKFINDQNKKAQRQSNHLYLILCAFLFNFSLLQAATFTVSATNETCLGNGTLTFNLQGVSATAQINFHVYLLPNETIPIVITQNNILEGLSSGEYWVSAEVIDQGNTSVYNASAFISNQIPEPIVFSLSGGRMPCNNEGYGMITVEVTQGNPQFYEIISGPVILAPQTSNELLYLSVGAYNIRVIDECGEAYVMSYFLDFDDSIRTINVTPLLPTSTELIDCNTIDVKASVNSNFPLEFPITIQYNIYPPDQEPISYTHTFSEGTGNSLTLATFQLPFYNDLDYPYTLTFIDGCGNEILQNQSINYDFIANAELDDAICGLKFLQVALSNFVAPLQFNLITSPEGFDPTTYNEFYPNFNSSNILIGEAENPLPIGAYSFGITDACGSYTEIEFEVIYEDYSPASGSSNNGVCDTDSGSFAIFFVFESEVAQGVMVNAPANFNVELPYDLSDFIDEDGYLMMSDLPVGDYQIDIIDTCGVEHTVDINIPIMGTQNYDGMVYIQCDGGGILTYGVGIVEAIITEAPQNFPYPLPYNVSEFLDENGYLYLEGVPSGSYMLNVTSVCGDNFDAMVVGQENGVYEITEYCSSFSVLAKETYSGPVSTQFWLQKFDENNQVWTHPVTGAIYQDGDYPNTTTAQLIPNNSVVNNLTYSGYFRILKTFTLLFPQVQQCFSEQVYEFSYHMDLNIVDLYAINCNGSSTPDVVVIVEGIGPFNYKITSKDGQPFIVNNANNNVFVGLTPGVYNFEVSDGCGNLRNQLFSISSLESLFNADKIPDQMQCSDTGEGFYSFNFSDFNQDIIPSTQLLFNYNITYHLSEDDALNGINPLPEPYTNVSPLEEIFVRMVHNQVDYCVGISSFFIGVLPTPYINMQQRYILCEEVDSLSLTIPGNFDSYQWSNGEVGAFINITEEGTYTLTLRNELNDFYCENSYEFTIIKSSGPKVEEIKLYDWRSDDNSFTVIVSGSGDYLYSLDGTAYQESNVFEGLKAGLYQVYIKDKNGCGEVLNEELWLLSYPKYFTPNGDGIHDRWKIEFSFLEPDMKIYIYDRFGAMIIAFDANYPGWDGTLNGKMLPSSDYWFLVKRQDGREHRGHFSLKR